jgi:hypothetical protein
MAGQFFIDLSESTAGQFIARAAWPDFPGNALQFQTLDLTTPGSYQFLVDASGLFVLVPPIDPPGGTVVLKIGVADTGLPISNSVPLLLTQDAPLTFRLVVTGDAGVWTMYYI